MVRGEGTGGPNQEFALALAVELEGVEGWASLAVDTDGNDGPTDAAGGLVTGQTAAPSARATRPAEPSTRTTRTARSSPGTLSSPPALRHER